MDIKILVWKGYSWRNLLKLQSYEWSYYLIQLVTLSKYVHAGVLIDGKYLYQALMNKGIVVEKVDPLWIQDQVNKNRIDVFIFRGEFSDETLEDLQKLIKDFKQKQVSSHKIGNYDFVSLLNSAWYSFFGFTFRQLSRYPQKSICSELVENVLRPLNFRAHLVTPSDIAENDDTLWRVS